MLIEGIGGLLELLVGEEVRRRVLDAAGLHVADPGTRGPARAAVLEELRGRVDHVLLLPPAHDEQNSGGSSNKHAKTSSSRDAWKLCKLTFQLL